MEKENTNTELTTQGFFLDQFVTEQTNEFMKFRIPIEFKILLDEKELRAKYEDIRSVEKGIWSNGDQDITIWFKQNQVSECGRIVHYR